MHFKNLIIGYVGARKGIIIYKSMSKSLVFGKHLKTIH
jgi:hypothetical protein